MKFLVLILLFVFSIFNQGSANHSVQDQFTTSEEVVGITIVMIDEVLLRVDLGNLPEYLDKIEVFSQSGSLLMTITSCNNLQECTSDISSLGSGTYDVEVTTTQGSTYNATVVLP